MTSTTEQFIDWFERTWGTAPVRVLTVHLPYDVWWRLVLETAQELRIDPYAPWTLVYNSTRVLPPRKYYGERPCRPYVEQPVVAIDRPQPS